MKNCKMKNCLTFGISYPMICVSSKAVCGTPVALRVSKRKVSRSVASTYGKLEKKLDAIYCFGLRKKYAPM